MISTSETSAPPPGATVPARHMKWWIAVAVLIALVLLVWGAWPLTVLQIRVGEGGPLARQFQVSPGDRITYTYLHSVEKRPVDEILEVVPGDDLVVRETVYDMFGAGLPSSVIDGDFYTDPKDGKFHITNMSRDIHVMRVRVAFTAQQTLLVGKEKFRLDSLAPPTSLLVVQAVTLPRFATLLQR